MSIMTQNILSLDALNPDDVQNHGGKAVNLAHLHRFGFNVPSGLSISNYYFEQILDSIQDARDLLKKLDSTEDYEEVLEIAVALQSLVGKCEISEELRNELSSEFKVLTSEQGYAVRSSATVEDRAEFSFAGQAESYLCVHSIDDIIESVKRVWLSALSPSVAIYLKTKDVPMNQVRMGVVVQEMIDADIAGVMFTANVVENNLDQILIESTWGLGESLVSGKVVPDSFILDKESKTIVSKSLGTKEHTYHYGPTATLKEPTPPEKREKFSLSNEKLVEIAQIGIEIEEKMGAPQDIEWCFRGDELLILQTRPITTLG
ncbi:MAG: PEP/pyruvate-binding domain-containing protein [Candidatus Thorarchaeota archaeon]|jgi:pyruvate,water dikinase